MTSTIALSVIAIWAWWVLFFGIPLLGREAALGALHALRDRVYTVAELHPKVRKTLIYRDVEFVFAASINMVRERPFIESYHYVVRAFISPTLAPAPSWRSAAYLRERDEYGDDLDTLAAIQVIENTCVSIKAPLFLYVAVGHPAMFILTMATMGATVGVLIGRSIVLSFSRQIEAFERLTQMTEAMTPAVA